MNVDNQLIWEAYHEDEVSSRPWPSKKYLIDLYNLEIREVDDESFDDFVHGVGVNRGEPLKSGTSEVGTVYGGLDSRTGKAIHPKLGIKIKE